MRDGNYVDAINIFIFTEVKQIAPLSDTVGRMATVLDELPSTVTGVSASERASAGKSSAALASDMETLSTFSLVILIAVRFGIARGRGGCAEYLLFGDFGLPWRHRTRSRRLQHRLALWGFPDH